MIACENRKMKKKIKNKVSLQTSLERNCGGVKPGPMRWAQVQRFINNTSEENKL